MNVNRKPKLDSRRKVKLTDKILGAIIASPIAALTAWVTAKANNSDWSLRWQSFVGLVGVVVAIWLWYTFGLIFAGIIRYSVYRSRLRTPTPA